MKTMTTMMAAATLALGAAGSALADPAYPDSGTINPVSYTFEAVATGDVKAYFLGSDAGDTDLVYWSVGNGPINTAGFDNHASTRGASTIDLGSLTAGEKVTFYMYNTVTKDTYSTGGMSNTDGISHVYSTDFAGDDTSAITIPEGTFIAFEDLPKGNSDYDYNDVAFSVTNIVAVPEPANMALLLAGLGLVGFMARRRRG